MPLAYGRTCSWTRQRVRTTAYVCGLAHTSIYSEAVSSATGAASATAEDAKLLPLKVSGVMPQNAVICTETRTV